ncbi:hypothetical protein F5884DRAFT_685392 [Xylogone sp. PMI_703]|nr:hypothetical protein F5884DRAFT_685392 [Xylogone sp. PMI_703]
MTYYIAGLGACGSVNDGSTEKIVALAEDFMGSDSNNNSYCGKEITITCLDTNKSTKATVRDKCTACKGFSIDLSMAAFIDLDDLLVGRAKAAWYFND